MGPAMAWRRTQPKAAVRSDLARASRLRLRRMVVRVEDRREGRSLMIDGSVHDGAPGVALQRPTSSRTCCCPAIASAPRPPSPDRRRVHAGRRPQRIWRLSWPGKAVIARDPTAVTGGQIQTTHARMPDCFVAVFLAATQRGWARDCWFVDGGATTRLTMLTEAYALGTIAPLAFDFRSLPLSGLSGGMADESRCQTEVDYNQSTLIRRTATLVTSPNDLTEGSLHDII
jgi:hypothetical protein